MICKYKEYKRFKRQIKIDYTLNLKQYQQLVIQMQRANQNIESAILFDVKEEALTDMTLSQHINRLCSMRDFLNTAISNNKISLDQLRQVSRTQTSQLQAGYQMLQNQIKTQLNRMKNMFEPTMNLERRQLSEMKNQVSKINSQQLSTKKGVLNCQAMIDHCQNQMGYIQIKANRPKQ